MSRAKTLVERETLTLNMVLYNHMWPDAIRTIIGILISFYLCEEQRILLNTILYFELLKSTLLVKIYLFDTRVLLTHVMFLVLENLEKASITIKLQFVLSGISVQYATYISGQKQ
jgi:hypothetical protein